MLKARRIMMMMGTITVGTILVFLDAPLFLTLLGSVSMGAMMLVLLGANGKTTATAAPEQKKKKPATPILQRIAGWLSRVSKVPERILEVITPHLMHFKRAPAEEVEREIDALLDMAIREPINPIKPDPVVASADEGVSPPSSSVRIEDFEEELAKVRSFVFDDDIVSGSENRKESYERAAEFEDNPAANPGPDTEGDIAFEIDAAFLDIGEVGLEVDPTGNLPEIEDQSDLGESFPFDSDEINAEEEGDNKGADPDEEGFPSPASLELQAEGFNPDISEDADSEIIHILRSESNQKVRVQDLSLLRAMKDVRVSAADLSAELEEILGLLERITRNTNTR